MVKLKKWYINFLENDKKSVLERIFNLFLEFLSAIYAVIVHLKNFLYDKKLKLSASCPKKIISIGNLSWGGSGKTTLAILLHQKLSLKFKTAVLRRGCGRDENKLLEEKGITVFSSPDRAALAIRHSPEFDIFILDDGFQHRKLNRSLDIVIMGAREFRKPMKLIPADIFREPLASLKRAHILILSYSSELNDYFSIKTMLGRKFPNLKIYCADYKPEKIITLNGQLVSAGDLENKSLAAMTAVGYPKGFFKKIENLGIIIKRKIIYPDHHELTDKEFKQLQDELLKEGIDNLIITRKDKYHLPTGEKKINIFILDITMCIENEQDFLEQVFKKIAVPAENIG